jgi:hypothetical protein
MSTKLRVLIATSFKEREEVLPPLGIWSSHAFSVDGVEGTSISLVNKTHTIKQFAEDFVDEVNALRKECTESDIIGAITVDLSSKNYVIVSFYEQYDKDVFTMSNTVLDEAMSK